MSTQPSSISLTCTWSKDENLAYISGTLYQIVPISEIIDQIKKTLEQNSITFGIQEKRLELIATELSDNQFVDQALIAVGKLAKPGEDCKIVFSVNTYSLEEIQKKSNDSDSKEYMHYIQLSEKIVNPDLVSENDEIGTFLKGQNGEDGMSIFGKPTEAKAIKDISEILGRGLIPQEKSEKIIATMSGIVIRREDQYSLLPILVDGIAHLVISEDNMKVLLYLIPAGPNGKDVTVGDIKQMLEEQSVCFGIKYEAINQAIRTVKETGKKVEGFLIAEGKGPIPGKDTELKYLVDLSFTKIPKIHDDGKADYFDIHVFESVKKGQPIAEIIPLTKGEPGKNVFGTEIEAPVGNKMRLSLGKNVDVANEKSPFLVATESGHVYLERSTLFVEEMLMIEKNVDFSTGNINFHGDVLVKGDVISGFSVKSKGTIYVDGIVEDANLEAQASVIVRGGFVGRGKGKIVADKDVIVRNVLNQTITAKNNIMIEGESIEANLFAGNKILMEKFKALLVGGSAVACKGISVYNIGSSLNSKTTISCGMYHFVQQMLQELEQDISRIDRAIEKIKIKLENLSLSSDKSENQMKYCKMLNEKLSHLQQEQKQKTIQFKKNKKYADVVFNEELAKLSVNGTIYPKVTIKISLCSYVTNESFSKCVFYLEGDKIYYKKLTKKR